MTSKLASARTLSPDLRKPMKSVMWVQAHSRVPSVFTLISLHPSVEIDRVAGSKKLHWAISRGSVPAAICWSWALLTRLAEFGGRVNTISSERFDILIVFEL